MNIDPNVVTALVAYEDNATNAVQQIMKDVVSEASVDRYNSENILFLLWLFNFDSLSKQIIHDFFHQNLIGADKNNEGKKIKKVIRKVCKDTINALTPKGGNNCPIVISKFNFNIFVHSFTTS